MPEFWRFARRMLRHPWLLAMAAACALVSAGGLGVGLVSLAPVLRNILSPEGDTLPAIAGRANEWLRGFGVLIPQAWIERLPADRFRSVFVIVCALAGLTVIGAAANFVHAFLAQTLAMRTVSDVRRDAFKRVVHMPLKTVVSAPGYGAAPQTTGIGGVADIVSRLVNDAVTMAGGFLALVDKAPAQVLRGAVAFIAAVVIDPYSLAAVPVAVVMGVIIRKLGKRVRRASRGALQAQSKLLGATTETVQGLRVVKLATNERREIGRFTRFNRDYLRETMRARVARALAGPLLEAIGIFVLGAWALVFARQIIRGEIDPGGFFTSLAALGVAAASLKPLSGIVQEIQAAGPAARRMAELIDAEAEESRVEARRSARRALARHARSIEFDHVTFRYPGFETPAIDDVSLAIRHGETVAFVGGNGSGKTTLLSLIPRLFEPERGRVLIDGIDVRDVGLRSLRRQIGVVTQEVVLFRGTLASNIRYGEEGARPEDVIAAARMARAHDFIMEKPGGYDAPVGEQGVTLSGGQRQRIALARAFLRDPSILVLDEATSMIDAESERQISLAVAEFSRGRTTLVIAHRLSTVVSADRIVVMDGGRIIDVGRHEQLLARCEAYRVLTSSQLIAGPV